MTTQTREAKSWLDAKLSNRKVRRAYDREVFVEAFLREVEKLMEQQELSRSDLARRLECKPSNVTQLLQRTRNLTAETMADIAYSLNRRVEIRFRPRDEVAALGRRTDTCGQAGIVVTLRSAIGLIERVVVEDLGEVITVCRPEELAAARREGRSPNTVGFKKADIHR